MREIPYPFKAPMVRAILHDTKTQTRRLDGLKAINADPDHYRFSGILGGHAVFIDKRTAPPVLVRCNARAGDRIWIREAHSIGPGPHVGMYPGETAGTLAWPHVTYAADGAVERRDTRWQGVFGKARPPMFMFRWASRITLDITDVRVERLNAISDADAIAEGAWTPELIADVATTYGRRRDEITPAVCFHRLWEVIHGNGSWQANPWVFVIEFKRLQLH